VPSNDSVGQASDNGCLMDAYQVPMGRLMVGRRTLDALPLVA
jgi:hypothetical protein